MKINIKQPKIKTEFQIQTTATTTQLENIEITATQTTQTFDHPNSNGYDVITVNAVDNTIDENIVSENIKNGVNILGVTGSLAIPSGTIDITENGTVDVTNYASANVDVSGGGADLNDYFVKQIRAADGSAYGYSFMLKTIPDDTVVYGTSLEKAFNYCKALITIPLIDTSAVTNMSNCFSNCVALTSIPLINTAKVTSMKRMFFNCYALTTIPVLSTVKVTDMEGMFNACSNLSNESLNNIMEMCINVNKDFPSYQKKLSTIGLSSEQATTCQDLSNYQAFLDAGWTTGY